jgi:hypothetical protein
MRTNLLLPAVLLLAASAGFCANLEPRLVQLDKLVLNEDFSTPRELEKENWSKRQHTQWAIKDGVLQGIPSSAEFQATAKDHQGFEPRLSIPSCPDDYAIKFSLRFIGGEETAICPFIEFGHHKARLRWSKEGAQLMVDHESIQVNSDSSFKLKPGTWYHALAEVRGDEILIRFSHGPELYAKHPTIAEGKNEFGIAGPKGSTVELDNLKVWSIKNAPAKQWAALSKKMKAPAPVILKPQMIKGS